MIIISLCGYFSHSEPLFEKLNVLKSAFTLLNFCYDFTNNSYMFLTPVILPYPVECAAFHKYPPIIM